MKTEFLAARQFITLIVCRKSGASGQKNTRHKMFTLSILVSPLLTWNSALFGFDSPFLSRIARGSGER